MSAAAGAARASAEAARAAEKKGADLEALQRAVAEGLEVSAPDDTTIVYRLRRRSPSFLPLTTLSPMYPVRADLIAKHGDRWTEPGLLVTPTAR